MIYIGNYCELMCIELERTKSNKGESTRFCKE